MECPSIREKAQWEKLVSAEYRLPAVAKGGILVDAQSIADVVVRAGFELAVMLERTLVSQPCPASSHARALPLQRTICPSQSRSSFYRLK